MSQGRVIAILTSTPGPSKDVEGLAAGSIELELRGLCTKGNDCGRRGNRGPN